MNSKILFSVMVLAASTPLQMASANDDGKALHDTKCLGCHDSHAYTRKDRTVKSLSALSKRVTICTKQAAKADWNDKQIQSVVDYLNTQYYKF